MDIQIELEKVLEDCRNRIFDRTDAEKFLSKFGAYLEMGPIELGPDGSTELLIDNTLKIGLVHTPSLPGIILLSELDAAISEQPDLMIEMLQSNLDLASRNGGCFVSISGIDAPVYCQLILPDGQDCEQFDIALTSFISSVRAWLEYFDAALLELDIVADLEKIIQTEPTLWA